MVPEEFAPGGCFERLATWLDSNMGRFGFFRPYGTTGAACNRSRGMSYAPVALPALEVLSLDVLREALEAAPACRGQQAVLDRLPEFYERYVLAVDEPS